LASGYVLVVPPGRKTKNHRKVIEKTLMATLNFTSANHVMVVKSEARIYLIYAKFDRPNLHEKDSTSQNLY
jgi:hypothetical protein